MLQDDFDGSRKRMIDRALHAAALVSFCFGLTVMLAGLFR